MRGAAAAQSSRDGRRETARQRQAGSARPAFGAPARGGAGSSVGRGILGRRQRPHRQVAAIAPRRANDAAEQRWLVRRGWRRRRPIEPRLHGSPRTAGRGRTRAGGGGARRSGRNARRQFAARQGGGAARRREMRASAGSGRGAFGGGANSLSSKAWLMSKVSGSGALRRRLGLWLGQRAAAARRRRGAAVLAARDGGSGEVGGETAAPAFSSGSRIAANDACRSFRSSASRSRSTSGSGAGGAGTALPFAGGRRIEGRAAGDDSREFRQGIRIGGRRRPSSVRLAAGPRVSGRSGRASSRFCHSGKATRAAGKAGTFNASPRARSLQE